ncbi:MAG: RNA pseudouridine synthase, partial [Acidimicrobiia bacterium]|nr:RNA pseudouridine synthase [Acidimicrobiia bacterium]
VGDDRYGGSRLGLPLERPFLHAAELRFEHPRTGETMRFESALPDDLAVVVSRLETESGRTSGG